MKVPPALSQLFWDTDWQTIDVDRHRSFILDRVLEYGSIDAVRWAEQVYGLNTIGRYFQQRGRRVLSAKTRAFWQAVLASTQTSCTETSSPPPSNPLWKF